MTPEVLDRIHAAYELLQGRKRWHEPVPVWLTPRKCLIVGVRPRMPEERTLVARYTQPLPSLEEFTGDVEFELKQAGLLDVGGPIRAQILRVITASPKPVSARQIADQVLCDMTTVAKHCRELTAAGAIQHFGETGRRGRPHSWWMRPTTNTPAALPAGRGSPTRCVGRRPAADAKTCAVRACCARFRAIDGWNDMSDELRATTRMASHLCEDSDGFPHYLEPQP